ncbi:MAG: hypothetical protein ACRCT8_05080 [Lacipirellulaceae bacterium]
MPFRTRLILSATLVVAALAGPSHADPITGVVVADTDGRPRLELAMAVDATTTRLVLTGPSYSWFSWGFGATTMAGYSVVVEGTGASRTVVEQNLLGIGNEGSPQATQNLSFVSIIADDFQQLTTITLERASNTGDPSDPVFDTSLTSIPMIWAYAQFSSVDNPAPTLGFHGVGGRGFATLSFMVVPEPSAALLCAMALGVRRRGRRD